MALLGLFPTFVYQSPLARGRERDLNRRLLAEGRQLRKDDLAGRRWSAANYPGGYTSYGSLNRLQRISPTFAELELKLRRHVTAFTTALDWNLKDRKLAMTDCWINVMPRMTAHPLHLHPLSALSGTYYVAVPAGAPGIKFEDPRLDRFMAAPPRKSGARRRNAAWITVPVAAGRLVLFESWLRHEVMPSRVSSDRVSVSFNYSWF